jgi:hypothetical protein
MVGTASDELSWYTALVEATRVCKKNTKSINVALAILQALPSLCRVLD